MANRTFTLNQYTNVRDLIVLIVRVAFNGSSAPTLLKFDPMTGKFAAAPSAGDGYFKSFTRASTGNYTFTLVDNYVSLEQMNVTFFSNSNAAAPFAQIKLASDPTNGQAFGTSVGAGAVRTGAATINILTFSAQGTTADPGATEMAKFEFIMSNSTAG